MLLHHRIGHIFDSPFYIGRNSKNGEEQWRSFISDDQGREILIVPVVGNLRTPTYNSEEWSYLVEGIIASPTANKGGILAVRLLNRQGYVGSARILEFDFAVRAGRWFAHDEEFQVRVDLSPPQADISPDILQAYFNRKGTRVGIINFLSENGEWATILLDEDPLEEWERLSGKRDDASTDPPPAEGDDGNVVALMREVGTAS